MKKWTSKTNKNSPFEIDNITGGGYICFDCKNNNSFDGEFNIYRYYYKDDGEWDFDFEILVPMAIQCAECGSDDIVVEYNPGWYFSALKEGDECYNLTLISDNKLINFEDSEGYFKLFDQLGCNKDMRNNSSSIMDEMVEWELNDWDSINSDTNAVVVRIITKNGMEQNEEGIGVPESVEERTCDFCNYTGRNSFLRFWCEPG